MTLFILFVVFISFHSIDSYISDVTCNNAMAVGSFMMYGATVLSNQFTIQTFLANGTKLNPGSKIKAGSIINLKVPNIDTSYQYVMESTLGTFTDKYVSNIPPGTCKYSRTGNNYQGTIIHTLQLNAVGKAAISIVYQNADAACFISTVTFAVVGNVTGIAPTPSAIVTLDTNTKVRLNTSIGIAVSIGTIILIFTLVWFFPMGWSFFTNSNLCALLSIFLSLINFVLVINWATNTSLTYSTGFLGNPDWTNNPFAYHPLFMVAIVFNFQIYRYVCFDYLNKKNLGIVNDLLLLLILIGVIIGIVAINSWKNPAPNNSNSLHRPNLTSMHSWLGLWSAASILLTIFWHILLRFSADFAPVVHEGLKSNFSFFFNYMPPAAFFLSSMAICTGISDQFNMSACNPLLYNNQVYDYTNPSTPVYTNMPEACKYANGLGMSVCFSTILTAMMIRYRIREPQPSSTGNNAVKSSTSTSAAAGRKGNSTVNQSKTYEAAINNTDSMDTTDNDHARLNLRNVPGKKPIVNNSSTGTYVDNTRSPIRLPTKTTNNPAATTTTGSANMFARSSPANHASPTRTPPPAANATTGAAGGRTPPPPAAVGGHTAGRTPPPPAQAAATDFGTSPNSLNQPKRYPPPANTAPQSMLKPTNRPVNY